jgi:predicted ATPase
VFRGELLVAVGDLVAAEACLLQGIIVARRQSAKLWELEASISLARFWRGQGRSMDAHDLLAAVYNWFSEGFDTLVLKEAKSLLNNLGRLTE